MNSILGPMIVAFIKEKRSMGYKYNRNEYTLHRFDQYCIDNKLQDYTITREFLSGWLQRFEGECTSSLIGRVGTVRKFLIYLSSYGYDIYIPNQIPKEYKKSPYILTTLELHQFFTEVDNSAPGGKAKAYFRMSNEYKVIFRLIYTCGLRVSEACCLLFEDVDLTNGRFIIRNSKGNKDRLVYMAKDMTVLCLKYSVYLRDTLKKTPLWFFPARDPMKPISKITVEAHFNTAWEKTECSKLANDKPTIHSLRHTFVTNKINEWAEKGISLDVMGPYLSKYLGHSDFLETHYYYHYSEQVGDIIRSADKTSSLVIPQLGDFQ